MTNNGLGFGLYLLFGLEILIIIGYSAISYFFTHTFSLTILAALIAISIFTLCGAMANLSS
jgi:hypothetical protein